MDDDVLPGWTAQTLPLRPDGRSPDPVATLVHRTGTPSRRALLYVHGFVDYFFQTQFADAVAAHGYDVYALDLRDYGRSIRDGRPANHVTDLGAFAEEIDAAIRLIRADHDQVVLLGHSMGGLVTSLWADARRGEHLIDALVLNSPWLDLRGTWFKRTVVTRVLDGVGKVAPDLVVDGIAPYYGRALHEGTGGEWSYDLAWKPLDGFPARAGLARTIRRGHARVARGLDIDVPVLLLASDASGPDRAWHDALLTTDSVLDVADMKRLAPNLGRDVTYIEIPGGAHDLALSPAPARDTYVTELLTFLDARLG